MVSYRKELNYIKNEYEKVRKALEDTNPADYQVYATLLQAYFTLRNSVQQLEQILEKQKEEKRQQRIEELEEDNDEDEE